MERRTFMRLCAASAAAAAAVGNAADLKPRYYSRARLMDGAGKPLKASTLKVGNNYIFHYPYQGTPCFLLNLGKPTPQNVQLRTEGGQTYGWGGGVGPQRAIVSYSAICTHRMTYPTRQISFISYRDRSTATAVSRANTIHCCSEHSEYDPANGARVLNGPAPQPLAAVLLEYEPQTDGIYAVGTAGGEIFRAFFDKYEVRLALDYGSGRARERVGSETAVAELTHFCKQQVRC